MQERIRLPRPVQRGTPHHLEAPAGIKYPGRRILFIDVQQDLGMAAAEILQQGRTDASTKSISTRCSTLPRKPAGKRP